MILEGLMQVLQPMTIVLVAIGVAVGIIFGSIPGLTATMAIVMFLPVTYSMSASEGISMLMALYIGGISGGLISAILLNIPGTPSSVATCFDGKPLADKGEAGKALGTGVVFSFVGTIIGIALLVILAPVLCDFALKFQAYEYCALALFSLSMVIALTGHDMPKGLISAVLGALLATVGLAPIDSRPRFTFGMYQLNNGFALVVLLIGLFAISEVMAYAESVRQKQDFTIRSNVKIKGVGFTFKEFVGQLRNAVVSALIGVGIGILPGIGGGVSCMISYTVSKNTSKHRELYGTGIMDGVVASETANNGTIGGAMIPLLSLGIPGDAATAMLLGGLQVHNVAPGPLIYEKNGVVVYAIFFAMVLSAIFMMLFMLLGMRFFISVLKVPKNYLLPVVVVLCGIGAIGNANALFDTYCMVGFGLMSYLMIKSKIPTVPMILGFILGPTFEQNLRRVSQLASSDSFIGHPIFCVLIVATVFVVIFSVRANLKDAKRAQELEAAELHREAAGGDE
ncbi:tripartite tricarboxylate transporter permease [uncultured Oscillibacter sp.]|uniref:tripartite tricarboxylate transporter permease n=1 Tax=uncultured Oscillibacter sp. TaxID=876091 RepID=UPI002614CBD6|nr:tripartite tricarboxylate transporter permease [uncultured Oscillibacter sp.]